MFRRFVSKSNIANYLLIVITFIFLLSCAAKEESKKRLFKIGVVLPLTGDAAQYGIDMRRGAQLAVDEYNSSNPDIPIHMIVEDSQGLPRVGLTVTKNIIENEKVSAVISALSGVILASIPTIEENHVVMINAPANSPKLRGISKYLINLMVLSDQEGKYLANIAYKNLNRHSAVIIYTNNDSGVGFNESIKRNYISNGGNLIASFGQDQNKIDYRVILLKIKKINPDIIFLATYYKEAAVILRQAKELGIDIQFLTYSAIESPEFLKIAGEAANGVIYSQPGYNDLSLNSEVVKFKKMYRNKYNEDPDIWSAQFYDAMNIITKSISILGDTAINSEKLRKFILNTNYGNGVTGPINFDDKGELKREFTLKCVSNNKFKNYY